MVWIYGGIKLNIKTFHSPHRHTLAPQSTSKCTNKEFKVVGQFFKKPSVWEFALSLAHTWDTGPKHKHRALLHATTLYGFPIQTTQCRRSEMWLLQIAFLMGKYSGSLLLASANRRRKFSWLLFQLILMISFENEKDTVHRSSSN